MFWMHPVTLRVMVPKRRQDRPVWEISIDGRTIGWLAEHQVGRSTVTFYNATGIYRQDGRTVDLQNDSNFRHQLEMLIEFDQDPERFRGVHLH